MPVLPELRDSGLDSQSHLRFGEPTILPTINAPRDLADLGVDQLNQLAAEIRGFLIENVSRTGGHLGPNLGVVELTIALHRVFDSPNDAIIFDTGHQAYVHKILTGRQDFEHLRQSGGLSGYPSRRESRHDVSENSHASAALSWADGVAKGRRVSGLDDQFVVAIVGDGALTGGMAWEALNNISESDLPIVIVVNDNGRSYSQTIGGMAHHLDTLRTTQGYEQFMEWGSRTLRRSGFPGLVTYKALSGLKRGLKRGIQDMVAPQGLFEDLGIKYLGPVDGHEIPDLERALSNAKAYRRPVIVHVLTEKGHGYRPAEDHLLDKFHNVGPMHPETGLPMNPARWGWTSVFADELVKIGRERPDVVAITAAMLEPVGLHQFAAEFPERTFDVGIAEQHAVASAAGLAYAGLHPVVAVYATFLNRAFDQVLMDVGLHGAGVTFVLDRAGITGDDGPSHHGMWDFTLLRIVPGVRIAAPRDDATLRAALRTAVAIDDAPTVIRFPKGELAAPSPALAAIGEVEVLWRSANSVVEALPSHGQAGLEPIATVIADSTHNLTPDEVASNENESSVLLVGIGSMVPATLAAAKQLAADQPTLRIDVVSLTWVWPIPAELVALTSEYDLVVTVEDGLAAGGIGSALEEAAAAADIFTSHVNLGVPTQFLAHATRDQVLNRIALNPDSIAAAVVKHLEVSALSQPRQDGASTVTMGVATP